MPEALHQDGFSRYWKAMNNIISCLSELKTIYSNKCTELGGSESTQWISPIQFILTRIIIAKANEMEVLYIC